MVGEVPQLVLAPPGGAKGGDTHREGQEAPTGAAAAVPLAMPAGIWGSPGIGGVPELVLVPKFVPKTAAPSSPGAL